MIATYFSLSLILLNLSSILNMYIMPPPVSLELSDEQSKYLLSLVNFIELAKSLIGTLDIMLERDLRSLIYRLFSLSHKPKS